MELFHNKSLVEEKDDKVVIRDIFVTNEKKLSNVNNIDKKYKEDKNTDKKHGILVDFHTVGNINTDGNKMVQLKNYL